MMMLHLLFQHLLLLHLLLLHLLPLHLLLLHLLPLHRHRLLSPLLHPLLSLPPQPPLKAHRAL
jgi:hypothetical protein